MLNADKKWKRIKHELDKGRTIPLPMPEKVVRRRELLLLAQCELADYQFEKLRTKKSFFEALYRKTMEIYFSFET